MVGFLIFLNSLAFMPHYFFVVTTIYILLFRRDTIKYRISRYRSEFLSFAFVILLVTANFIINSEHQAIPGLYALPFTLIISLSLIKRDIEVFLFCICAECLVGIFEYYTGITKLFAFQGESQETELDSISYLYDFRVSGLSKGPSIFGGKVLLSIILLTTIRISNILKAVLFLCLCIGLYVTFIRTAVLNLFVFLVIYYRKDLYSILKMSGKKSLLAAVLVVCSTVVVIVNADDIINQFTRGTDSVEISGRDVIWAHYFNYIIENPMGGNGSVRLLLDGGNHAHNSYIQFIADNGIVIFLFFMLVLFRRINKSNFVFILPLAGFSLTQFGIFWGYSEMDVFLYYFLFCNLKYN